MRTIKIQLHDDEYHTLAEIKKEKSWREFLVSPHLPQLTFTAPDLRFNFALARGYAKIGLSVKRLSWPKGCKMYKSRRGMSLIKEIGGKTYKQLTQEDKKADDWIIARSY